MDGFWVETIVTVSRFYLGFLANWEDTLVREYTCIRWSKPGSINTPQKQDENRGFGPGQAAGRTPGKLGGNMPVKLAKIRGKKRAANRVEMLPQKAQPGPNINYLYIICHYLLPSWDAPGITSIVHCRTPGAYRVFIIAFSACQADGLKVSSVQRRALDWTSWLRGPWFHSKAAQAATAPASSAELTTQLKTVLAKERLNCD